MTINPQSSFTVSSGNLCYGEIHNILTGGRLPKCSGLPSAKPQDSGTVTSQQLDFNVAAKNGTWNCFELLNNQSKRVCAWFLCHSDSDPWEQVQHILRVAGSPYESDFGSRFNDENTEEAKVFVINRYDWGGYDNRSESEFNFSDEAEDWNGNGVGVADYSHAEEVVKRWKGKPNAEKEATENGIWLHIPSAEYLFGRFGFDESGSDAVSFLYFTDQTNFTRTTFAGQSATLKKFETPEEIFERRLNEDWDFSGIDHLDNFTNQSVVTPLSERRGPFNKSLHLLTGEEIQHLFEKLKSEKKISFTSKFEEEMNDLLNEVLLSYLDKFIVGSSANSSLEQAASSLFPKHEQKNTVDQFLYDGLVEGANSTVGEEFKRKTKEFLGERLSQNDAFVSGICKGMEVLLKEVLELACNNARDGSRKQMVPQDLRFAILHDEELMPYLSNSKVYWSGR
eukprot:TRINITY_DN4772_c0_g1_i1.p1 TRINITY_DN4772_c0_g1~~TRINITY_DN4772_c0_g1_i1.p1  ORF type:complete len:452 (+),score=109.95 TRINITY_DN4772_c0_g1_i1:106-1461(+)